MKLNIETYKDKTYACWLGKNLGGTLGTPYEGVRKFLDVKGFKTEKNVVLPNDDLDLQLVWLRAVELYGARAIDSQRLGECWLSFITPHWNEYGLGKIHMRKGFYPPMSGDVFTTWKHSNGAWIRTEIWACFAPGAVDVAVDFARQDACVDHGAYGEGTVAAAFVAALESAAFFESDVKKLIKIGLSRIPEQSRVAKSVRTVMECYEKGIDYQTARNTVLEQNMDIGDGWFEAPSNVAYVTIGLLYGEGDFKKSLIYTVNCGDDTDCTAGTVGAILGIMGGTAAIPQDWREHIGDNIVTMSIALGVLARIPKTCVELTERVVRLTPSMLFERQAGVELTEGETERPESYVDDLLAETESVNARLKEALEDDGKYFYTVDFLHTKATVIYPDEPKIQPLQTVKVKIRFAQNRLVNGGWGASPYHLSLRFWAPDGFSVKGEKCVLIPSYNSHTREQAETELEIIAPEHLEPINRIVVEATASDKMTIGYVPITFLG